MLTPNNACKTTSQKEPDATELLKCFVQTLIKETLHHRNGFSWAKCFSNIFLIFSKELPSDVGSVLPPMLSEWIAVEPMFH